MLRKGRLSLLFSAMIAVIAIAATSATAATKIGSDCVAMETAPGFVFQSQVAPGGPTYTVPHDGVITGWGVNVIPFPGAIPERLKIFRPSAATPGTYDIVAESELATALGGQNNFKTRVAVKAGDQITAGSGYYYGAGALICDSGDAADVIGLSSMVIDPPIGSSFTQVDEEPGILLALNATIEPDVDADGYGDESQDGCPQTALMHEACQDVVLQKFIVTRTTSLGVLLMSNTAAPVTLTGTVDLPATNRGKTSTVAFKPVTRTLAPGTFANINLKYGKTLIRAIRSSSPKTRFKLKLQLSAKGVLRTTNVPFTVTVRGTNRR